MQNTAGGISGMDDVYPPPHGRDGHATQDPMPPAVIVQWPERIQGASKEDIEGWLKLVGSKLKRAVDAAKQTDESPSDEE